MFLFLNVRVKALGGQGMLESRAEGDSEPEDLRDLSASLCVLSSISADTAKNCHGNQ